MSRQIEAGAKHRVGTGSADRIDPFALPVRFAAPDAAADGGERRVTLESDRVILDRMVRSVVMRIAVPLPTFSGVVVRAAPADDRLEIVLGHRDRGLDVPLALGPCDEDGLAEWRLWGRALQMPLLIEEDGGARLATDERLGALIVGRPRPRRGRSYLKGRRTRFQAKRAIGALGEDANVHRGEREIIARD